MPASLAPDVHRAVIAVVVMVMMVVMVLAVLLVVRTRRTLLPRLRARRERARGDRAGGDGGQQGRPLTFHHLLLSRPGSDHHHPEQLLDAHLARGYRTAARGRVKDSGNWFTKESPDTDSAVMTRLGRREPMISARLRL